MRIASRGSALALWQAGAVRDRLRSDDPDLQVEIEIVRTTGDRVQDVPLAQIGDRGLFTKEVDTAVVNGTADIAVHSLKDVPTRVGPGLRLAAVTRREDPRDVLAVREGTPRRLLELPRGARIGTSSLRRRAQLRAVRPDLHVLDLRGNLDTRLARLDAGDFDGILLAAAGLIRLGWRDRISDWLDPEDWLPAVGQGALAIFCREDDEASARALASLHHSATAAAVTAERAFLGELEGGCQVPIGALAEIQGDRLVLSGLVADLDGEEVLRGRAAGAGDEAAALGRRLAAELIERGAERILREIRRSSSAPPIPAP